MRQNPGMPESRTPKLLPRPRKPVVIHQPVTYKYLQQGVDLIANAIRPTLGPRPRLVGMERILRAEPPDILDDGATIARRIIQVQPRATDVGAMLLRSALWQMHLDVGDGTATTAVLYQAMLKEGIRYVTEFGANAMLLRAGLEKASQVVLQALRAGAIPLSDRYLIAQIASGMCQEDPELAEMLGEIFDIVGPDGMIVVEGWQKAGLEREYIEGTFWELSGWWSRWLVTDPGHKNTIFEDTALLATNIAFKEPGQLVPVLEKCVKAGIKKLVIIASDVSDSVIGLLVNNNQAKTIQSLAVRAPRTQEASQVAAVEDIAVLTGGKAFIAAAHLSLDDFQVADLGHARRAWATESQFGIYGGKGDLRAIRQHMNNLRGKLNQTDLKEHFAREQLQKRLGRMHGGTAILRVGGLTDTTRETRVEVANRAVAGLRHAVQGGVVLGGGTALLKAQSALDNFAVQSEEDRLSRKIMAAALAEPLRTIAKNAGFSPDVVVDRALAAQPGYGFDARSGSMVDLQAQGILDALTVLTKALEIAVSGATMALTTDVMVLHRKPKEVIEP